MTREEREALIDKLRAENAETLCDLAAREARTAAGRDPVEWQVPSHHQSRSEIIRKDYAGNGNYHLALPPQTYMDDVTQRAWDDWLASHLRNWSDMLVDSLCLEIRAHVKKQDDELASRVDDLETRIGEIEDRLDALEGNGKRYQG